MHKYCNADIFEKMLEGMKKERLCSHGQSSLPPVKYQENNFILTQKNLNGINRSSCEIPTTPDMTCYCTLIGVCAAARKQEF